MPLITANVDPFFAHFAEEVVYRPNGGDDRTIMAVVNRRPPAPATADGGGLAPMAIISVRNSEEDGIGSRELDLGMDQILVAEKIGQEARPRSFGALVDQDDAILTLEVR